MADEDKKVDEAEAPAAEQVELVGEAEKAEAEAIEALPKVEEAAVPQAAKTDAKPSKDYSPRLKRDFDERIVPAMTERFGYKNRLEVPRLDKIVANMGVGEATQDKKKVETAAAE